MFENSFVDKKGSRARLLVRTFKEHSLPKNCNKVAMFMVQEVISAVVLQLYMHQQSSLLERVLWAEVFAVLYQRWARDSVVLKCHQVMLMRLV